MGSPLGPLGQGPVLGTEPRSVPSTEAPAENWDTPQHQCRGSAAYCLPEPERGASGGGQSQECPPGTTQTLARGSHGQTVLGFSPASLSWGLAGAHLHFLQIDDPRGREIPNSGLDFQRQPFVISRNMCGLLVCLLDLHGLGFPCNLQHLKRQKHQISNYLKCANIAF